MSSALRNWLETSPPHVDVSAANSARLDNHRRAAVVSLAMNRNSEGGQGRRQIGDRPFAHAGVSVEPVRPLSQATKSGQEPDAGAAVLEPQISLSDRRTARASHDFSRVGGRIVCQVDSQPLQAVDHHARIPAVENPSQPRSTAGQGRHDQRAVCDAFRARRPNRAPDRPRDRLHENGLCHVSSITATAGNLPHTPQFA
jgi:hypothetical protein